jgi:hypothetical protein
MPDFKIDFAEVTGEEDEDNSRALRLVLAAINDDLVQLRAVATDVYEDPRGFELTAWQMIVALSTALAREWVSRADAATVETGIRLALAGRYGADHD